jgi:hypothetical protein
MPSNFSDFVVALTAVCVSIFAGLNVEPDEKTPLVSKKRSYLPHCEVAPASRGNWGRETGTVLSQ